MRKNIFVGTLFLLGVVGLFSGFKAVDNFAFSGSFWLFVLVILAGVFVNKIAANPSTGGSNISGVTVTNPVVSVQGVPEQVARKFNEDGLKYHENGYIKGWRYVKILPHGAIRSMHRHAIWENCELHADYPPSKSNNHGVWASTRPIAAMHGFCRVVVGMYGDVVEHPDEHIARSEHADIMTWIDDPAKYLDRQRILDGS